jgi:lambda repressor-like predicted transcriptional regulator
MASKNGALAKNNPARIERDRTIAEERLKGKTYRELSEQFGLSKSVLHRILNDDEIRDVIETATSHMVSLVPKALDNYHELLDSKDEKIKLQASKDCLQTTGIMPSHTQSPVMINILNQQVNPSQTAELAQIAAFRQDQWQSTVIDITPDNKAGEAECPHKGR